MAFLGCCGCGNKDGPLDASVVESVEVLGDSLPNSARDRLKIEFVVETDKGSEVKTIAFQRQPVGIGFKHKLPLIVNTVVKEGHAEELGVQTGWKFKKIGDASVEEEEGLDFKTVMEIFSIAVKKLPESKKPESKK
mmetsp:Transcript_145436/g.268187  ORF Transcript_145436/g.268187 Transcript_145436/m.268187 type:complete len:136 (+) Transcript_145436:21-428(+)